MFRNACASKLRLDFRMWPSEATKLAGAQIEHTKVRQGQVFSVNNVPNPLLLINSNIAIAVN